MSTIRLYYNLCKPSIVYGNALTAIAGFFLASHGSFQLGVFLAMIAGISLVVASACVFNNYIDRDIDGKMGRTKDRALVSGSIPPSYALIYGAVLGVAGMKLLILYTNLLTAGVALFGFVIYVFVYTYAKRITVFSTDIGALSGAVPPVVGYTALSNNLDAGAILLFLILFVWQMPHFFAISIYREEDYRAAGMPVRPIVTDIFRTKLIMAFYAATFIFAALTLTIIGLAGYAYAVVLALTSVVWFVIGISGFYTHEDKKWARRMFLFSLIVITAFSLMLVVNWLV